jgi:endonuclease/exonuclease/phosphatase family metal-dependent hydrolase
LGQGLVDAVASRAPVAARLLHTDVHDTCASTDVLCVQELLSDHAQHFFDRVGDFVSRFRDHNRPTFWPTSFRGSGLGVASRRELLQPRVYSFCSPSVGWDRLARKGAIHTQVPLERGPVVDILSTHLQAGDSGDAARVRAGQLREVGALIKAFGSPERPFIVCGDFNIDGLKRARKSEEYLRLITTLDGFADLGAATDLPTFEPHPTTNALAHAFEPFGRRRRIDYVFFRPAVEPRHALKHTAVVRLFDQPLSEANPTSQSYASDHFGLCASFEYNPSHQ